MQDLSRLKLLSDNPKMVLVDVGTDAERRSVGVPDISELSRDLVTGSGRASTADAARGSSRN